MKLFGSADGTQLASDGQYLKDMDFEAHDGRGHLTTTPDLAEAKRFDSFIEAVEFWKRSPECHPVRKTDGKPNRPLTAFNWQFADPENL